jgi:mannose-6-phosphate isomerase-like protein (cupin superfamily)
MKHFHISALSDARRDAEKSYLEFVRETSLSMGLYVLAPGDEDSQQPHTEDEVYYVIRGKARFTANGEDVGVTAGAVLFVPASVTHRFHSIVEELSVLVVFAPPEGTRT